MASPFKFYLKHISSKSGYRANWEPNKPLQLGMIGKLTDGVLDVVSTLEQEGLTPKILKDDSLGELDYTSNDTVDIGIKLGGSAPVAGSVLSQAEAGFFLDFHGENAVVFQVKDTLTHQIINMGELEKEIIKRYKEGAWPKDWVIITQLLEAVSATIIVSNSSNNKIELKASANVGTPNLKLTDASLGLSVAREKGSSLKVIAQQGIMPLYRVMGVRHPFLGKPNVGAKGEEVEVSEETFSYQDFDPAELEDAHETAPAN
ncbi:MAG: hypothetical protein EOP50_04730 [Sphingobacteriales bacterium]|nr:MAG: hypothetical protein EOP50_04730 [Sphingobacteriales bacterium]